MKNKLTLIATSIILASTSMSANAKNNWFSTSAISAVNIDGVNTSSTAPVGGVSRSLDIESDTDVGFGGEFGKTLFTSQNGNEFSLSVSYLSSENDIDSIAFQGNNFSSDVGTAAGSLELQSLILRGTYKFNLGGVNPYIGLGIGIADLEVDARYGGSVGTPSGSQPPFVNDSDSALALEARIGLEIPVSKRFSLLAEYSIVELDDINLDRLGGGPGGLALTSQEGDLSYDALTAGLKFRF